MNLEEFNSVISGYGCSSETSLIKGEKWLVIKGLKSLCLNEKDSVYFKYPYNKEKYSEFFDILGEVVESALPFKESFPYEYRVEGGSDGRKIIVLCDFDKEMYEKSEEILDEIFEEEPKKEEPKKEEPKIVEFGNNGKMEESEFVSIWKQAMVGVSAFLLGDDKWLLLSQYSDPELIKFSKSIFVIRYPRDNALVPEFYYGICDYLINARNLIGIASGDNVVTTPNGDKVVTCISKYDSFSEKKESFSLSEYERYGLVRTHYTVFNSSAPQSDIKLCVEALDSEYKRALMWGSSEGSRLYFLTLINSLFEGNTDVSPDMKKLYRFDVIPPVKGYGFHIKVAVDSPVNPYSFSFPVGDDPLKRIDTIIGFCKMFEALIELFGKMYEQHMVFQEYWNKCEFN